MEATPRHPGHELILGGQRSGKSRCAESRAAAWLAGAGHSARLLVTALPGDAEMHERIARHRRDRAERLPALVAIEVPRNLAQALREHSAPKGLVVIDCLTLWLANLLMPLHGAALGDAAWAVQLASLEQALREAPGPVVLVSNEIGMGVSPLTAEARRFVDELGRLHQAVARLSARVSLMVAGLEMPVKRGGA